MKIAVVVSRFNEAVTKRLHDGALERLQSLGIDAQDIQVSWVPGAVELPIIAQQYAGQGCDAVICLGAVIRGETDHYDYVCQQASAGCQQVALTHNIPVIFGVLTTDNAAQALARAGGEHSHKGHEVAEAAIEMVTFMKQLSTTATVGAHA